MFIYVYVFPVSSHEKERMLEGQTCKNGGKLKMKGEKGDSAFNLAFCECTYRLFCLLHLKKKHSWNLYITRRTNEQLQAKKK